LINKDSQVTTEVKLYQELPIYIFYTAKASIEENV